MSLERYIKKSQNINHLLVAFEEGQRVLGERFVKALQSKALRHHTTSSGKLSTKFTFSEESKAFCLLVNHSSKYKRRYRTHYDSSSQVTHDTSASESSNSDGELSDYNKPLLKKKKKALTQKAKQEMLEFKGDLEEDQRLFQ